MIPILSNAVARRFLGLVFPASCLTCAADLGLEMGRPVCLRCVGKIKETPFLNARGVSSADFFFAPVLFEGIGRELVHLFKYKNKDYLARLLADLWIQRRPDLAPTDCIVPVPCAYWRRAVRGYSPPELLAQELGRSLRLPVRRDQLGRSVLSPSQTGLSRNNRLQNAQKSFYLKKSIQNERPASVLLIDDVCTTGATLSRCASLLKSAGVTTVVATAFAWEEGSHEAVFEKPILDEVGT